jgi:hypothetical protein
MKKERATIGLIFAILVILFLNGDGIARQGDVNRERFYRLQKKAQNAVTAGLQSCGQDNGSNYSSRPLSIKTRNADGTVTQESLTHLDGSVIKSTGGHYNFKMFTFNQVTIDGILNFNVDYVQGSTAKFTAKYSGSLRWILADPEPIDIVARYDYGIIADGGKMKYMGTVAVDRKVYNLKEDGTIQYPLD